MAYKFAAQSGLMQRSSTQHSHQKAGCNGANHGDGSGGGGVFLEELRPTLAGIMGQNTAVVMNKDHVWSTDNP